jgi:hypothetical protein
MADARDTAYTNFYEVAKGSVNRAREGAQFIEKAAAGIVTVYGVIIGVAFSAEKSPIPFRGVLPAAFLGLALVFASFYLAYPGRPGTITKTIPANAGPSIWFNAFADWMSNLTLYRGQFLRAALLALFFGLLFLPAPFVAVKTSPPTPPPATQWPDANGNPALEKIRFQAEVNEVAKLREKAAPQPKGEYKIQESWIWWGALAALIVLALSLLLPVRRGDGAAADDPKRRNVIPLHSVPYINIPDDTD